MDFLLIFLWTYAVSAGLMIIFYIGHLRMQLQTFSTFRISLLDLIITLSPLCIFSVSFTMINLMAECAEVIFGPAFGKADEVTLYRYYKRWR